MKVIDSSKVFISWLPPSSANGIILEYQVHYIGYKRDELGDKSESVSEILPCWMYNAYSTSCIFHS